MILQALNDYYQRLLTRGEEGLAAIGYSSEKISYEIVLTPAGEVCEVKDIRDTSGMSSFGILEPFLFRHLEATDFPAFRSQGNFGI